MKKGEIRKKLKKKGEKRGKNKHDENYPEQVLLLIFVNLTICSTLSTIYQHFAWQSLP